MAGVSPQERQSCVFIAGMLCVSLSFTRRHATSARSSRLSGQALSVAVVSPQEEAASKRSQETMRAMRGRVDLLSSEQEQAALSRLVGPSGAQVGLCTFISCMLDQPSGSFGAEYMSIAKMLMHYPVWCAGTLEPMPQNTGDVMASLMPAMLS